MKFHIFLVLNEPFPFRRSLSENIQQQRAVAVNIGKLMSDGRILLNEGVETEGVMWESPSWRLMDTGVIFFKNNNQSEHGI